MTRFLRSPELSVNEMVEKAFILQVTLYSLYAYHVNIRISGVLQSLKSGPFRHCKILYTPDAMFATVCLSGSNPFVLFHHENSLRAADCPVTDHYRQACLSNRQSGYESSSRGATLLVSAESGVLPHSLPRVSQCRHGPRAS